MDRLDESYIPSTANSSLLELSIESVASWLQTELERLRVLVLLRQSYISQGDILRGGKAENLIQQSLLGLPEIQAKLREISCRKSC